MSAAPSFSLCRTLRAAARRALLACALSAALPGTGVAQGLPRSELAVRAGGGWRTWWRAEAAPARWKGAAPALAGSVRWRASAPGVEWGETTLAGDGEAWRLRLVLVRLDPARVRLGLARAVRDGGTLGAWSVDSVPPAALAGLNAGHFDGGDPWGWTVRDGVELRPPGHGPLSMALVADTAGRVRLVPADGIAAVRARGGVALAVQSYPALLRGDGEVPPQLAAPGRGVDVEHRDSRLAVGELRDGRILLALTRFEGLGGVLEELPFGPTAPEMAAVMGALGCRQAVLLDGGLSGQLLLRERGGGVRAWRGMRRVPLGVLVFPAAGGRGQPTNGGGR
jgi:hypothetical protein